MKGVLENVARFLIVLVVLGSMFLFGEAADPGLHAKPGVTVDFADRILAWSFVVFSVGLAGA